MRFQVELLEDATKFIMSQPVKMQAKIQRTIGLLKEFGYELPEPHSKKIKGKRKLYELRIKLGSDICRMFYFHFRSKIYIITSGYIKKAMKTDERQIDIAIRLMTQFLEENDG